MSLGKRIARLWEARTTTIISEIRDEPITIYFIYQYIEIPLIRRIIENNQLELAVDIQAGSVDTFSDGTPYTKQWTPHLEFSIARPTEHQPSNITKILYATVSDVSADIRSRNEGNESDWMNNIEGYLIEGIRKVTNINITSGGYEGYLQ